MLRNIGTIQVATGTLVIGDCKSFDESWRPVQTVNSDWAVDIKGKHAEYLANRQGTFPRSELSDGTWRVICPDKIKANLVFSECRQLAMREEWADTRFDTAPLQASRMQAADAARATGAGLVPLDAQNIVSLLASGSVSVKALVDEDGKTTEIHLILS